MLSLCCVCTRGIQTSFKHIGTSKHMAVSTHIQGTSKHRGAPYVWMAPVHTQHKESMHCQTKGMSICPHKFGYPHMFECPLYVGMPPYVWMPPVYLDAPICLDASLYVWMPPVCLDATICLDAIHMFGCPTVCMDAAKCMAASKVQGTSKHIGGVQTYRASKHMGTSKHMGASKCMGGMWTPPLCDKACFLCVVYVQQTSKHHPNIWGCPNIWECPHIFRGIQT